MSDPFKRLVTTLLIAAGVALSGNLLVYCWELLVDPRYGIAGQVLLAYFIAYLVLQVYFVWYLYLRFDRNNIPLAPPGLSVDVFLPACNEPIWIVERALKSAKEITYPHSTHLLDDSVCRSYNGCSPLMKER